MPFGGNRSYDFMDNDKLIELLTRAQLPFGGNRSYDLKKLKIG